MISDELLQLSIINKLKANTTLVTALGTADVIKEIGWQGTPLVYPCLRIGLNPQYALGNTDLSRTKLSSVTWEVVAFSEKDSSREASNLGGLVHAALFNKQIAGVDLNGVANHRFIRIDVVNMGKPLRTVNRLWRMAVTFSSELNLV